jgi:hypothetical protein
MVAKPGDLQDTAKPDPIDNNYYNLTILDLDPSIDTQLYLDIQLAWLYKDITKGPDGNGISPYSTPIRIPLPFESLLPPKFISTDLTVYQGKLRVNWQGLNNANQQYDASLDYIDVLFRISGTTTWTSAGQFKKAGFILIPGIPKESYNVKLVAYSKAGKVSGDSDIQTITLVGVGPNKPLNVVGAWSGTNFKVTFNQDPAASGNEYLSYNKIELTSSLGDKKTIEFPLQPGIAQKFELSEADSNKFFGPQTAPAFSGKVWSVDIYFQEGDFESFGSVAYVSPLTAPTITLTQLVGGYRVAYTDQLTEETKLIFNNISIEESLIGPTSGFERKSFGSENPVTIETPLSFVQRWVRALVYDNIGGYPKIGGLPAYSNVATVTPKDETTDLTPPAIPSVAAGTPTATTIPITVTVADVKTTTISIRYKVFGSAVYSYETILNPAISTNAFTLTGLTPGTQYVIDVAGAKSAQIFSAYSTAATATTSASSITAPTIATQPTALETTSGFYVVWNASTSTNSTVTGYKIELYKAGVLNRTEYSGSLSISFTGLAASTSYYVKINGINNYGVSSTQVQSNAIITNAQGGISDGVGPTQNPAITSGMVKSLFGSFAITFPSVANADALIYEVFIKPTDGTGIIDVPLTYKVLEVGGTFAVIKTLADRTTALSYGTNYYIAVRAKDIDGVSTGAVTTVGPIQTLQVANADLAADSVFANNIKAGSIVASKIDADNLLASKLITVGAKTANISSATVSGANIVYTAAAHGFTSGQQVTTSQLTTSTFNVRDYLITAITTDTFTVVNSSGASGTISNQTGYASQIGTNAIRIDATRAGTVADPFKFYAGAGAYATSGTPFYLDSNGQFSLANKLFFAGSTLTVDGVIKATSGDITGALTLSGGTMKLGAKVNPVNIPESGQAVNTLDGIYLNDNNYWLSTSGWMKIGSATSYVKWNGTLLDISGQMKVTGTSTITGTLQISGGAFVAGAALTSGSRIKIDSTGLRAFDGNSTTDATGITTNLYANAAAGGITFATTAASIGNWTVGSSTIKAVSGLGGVLLDSSNVRIVTSPSSGAFTTGMSSSDTYAFWAGSAATSGTSTALQIAAAPFTVTQAGAVVANSATIRGVIKAESGGFGTFNASGTLTSGFTLNSGSLSSSSGSLVINGTTGAITGGSITGTTVTSSATAGKGKVQLDGTNSRILFNQDQTNSFSLDSDSTSILTYSYSTGTDTGADAGDGNTWYGSYYSTWAPATPVISYSEAISLKKTGSTEYSLNSPRLTLSIGGATYKSFLKISNQGSGPTIAAYSSITLQEGGIILSANNGALKIENMASAPHYSWTSANNFRVTGGTYLTGPTREVGVPLVIKSDGSVSTGRAIFKTSASEVTLTSTNGATNSYMYMGQDGDIMFSTAS